MKKNKLTNIKKILIIIGIIITISLMTIIIVNLYSWKKTNNKITIFNNFGLAIVASNSMEPELSKKDLIIIQKKKNYEVNDIVVYQKEKQLIVHRIIEINDNKITTKGDANEKEDNPIEKEKIYGKVQYKLSLLGFLIAYFKSKYGIISIVLLIIILFIYSVKKELEIMSKK